MSALARQQAHAHAADAVIALQEWTPRVLTARQNEAVVALTELIIRRTRPCQSEPTRDESSKVLNFSAARLYCHYG
jgi:hypothetical protein